MIYRESATFLNGQKSKAVPLQAMEALGGEEI
jgi:hypothetical protein